MNDNEKLHNSIMSPDRLTDEEFEELIIAIQEADAHLKLLQRAYEKQTGSRYVVFG